MSGQPEVKDFPSKVLPGPPAVVAGCVSVADAVNWSQDKGISEILDFMMSLEANTFDLYLKLGRQVKSEEARSVFLALSEKEKHHLETLASGFEKTI
jgi:rubrerythrin